MLAPATLFALALESIYCAPGDCFAFTFQRMANVILLRSAGASLPPAAPTLNHVAHVLAPSPRL
jgi:hypothetical protein